MTKGEDRSEIRIKAVGDIMLGMAYPRSIADDDNIPNRLKYDITSLIDKRIKKAFEESDIVFGNLECVISEDFNKHEKSLISYPDLIMSPPEGVNFLSDNFSCLNIANNHILDHGIDKAQETMDFLEKENIPHIGKAIVGESELETLVVKDKVIGFLGYNLCIPEKETGKSLSQYRTNREFSNTKGNIPDKKELQKKIIEQTKEKKEEVDFLIISLHWGIPQSTIPSPDQIKFGRKLIDEGADIILGHGPHIFQPIEMYKGKVIAYSMGNFIFDMWSKINLKSGILDIRLIGDDEIEIDIIPTIQRNYRVYIDESGDRLKDMIVDDLKKDYNKYQKENAKVKKNHYKGFIWQYISNIHKLPLGYHKYVLSNLTSKIIKKFLHAK